MTTIDEQIKDLQNQIKKVDQERVSVAISLGLIKSDCIGLDEIAQISKNIEKELHKIWGLE